MTLPERAPRTPVLVDPVAPADRNGSPGMSIVHRKHRRRCGRQVQGAGAVLIRLEVEIDLVPGALRLLYPAVA